MSIRNQARQRARILELAAELWKEQGELDLDQIDETFYFNLCKADEIQWIRDEGKDPGKHPMSTHERLRELIPNWQWPEYDRERPRMRDAADLSCINFGGRLTADGSMIERDIVPLAGLSWIRLGIRNREWTGTHVEKAFRNHKVVGGFGTTPMPNTLNTWKTVKAPRKPLEHVLNAWQEIAEPARLICHIVDGC